MHHHSPHVYFKYQMFGCPPPFSITGDTFLVLFLFIRTVIYKTARQQMPSRAKSTGIFRRQMLLSRQFVSLESVQDAVLKNGGDPKTNFYYSSAQVGCIWPQQWTTWVLRKTHKKEKCPIARFNTITASVPKRLLPRIWYKRYATKRYLAVPTMFMNVPPPPAKRGKCDLLRCNKHKTFYEKKLAAHWIM